MFNARMTVLVASAFLVSGQSSGMVLMGTDLRDGFYGDSPPFEVDGAPWLGLVESEGRHSLRPAELAWEELSRAPGADGPTYELTSSLTDALLLVSGITGLNVGSVTAADPLAVRLSERNPNVDLVLGGATYGVELESAYPEECRAVVTISLGETSQRIPVEQGMGCGDPHYTIQWAGDLDGDGSLDLVATFSMKYSYHPRQLYLSSVAAAGELVALAAMTDRTAS